ncbi:MAG: thioredoxin family protein [Thiobacillus sp.]
MRTLLATLLCIFTFSALADPPTNYPFVSYDQGLKFAKQTNKPVFLYFGRYGCAWCEHTNKKSFSNAGLKKLYLKHFVLVYVDAESGKRLTLPSGERITEAELGTRFNAFATPLFVFLTPQGEEIFKAPGFKTVQDFKDFDRFVTGGHYKSQTLLEFLGKK